MTRTLKMIHTILCITLIIELLGNVKSEHQIWQVLVLGLFWVFVAQVRLFFLQWSLLQQLSIGMDIILMTIGVFFFHLAPFSGLMLTGIVSLFFMSNPYLIIIMDSMLFLLCMWGQGWNLNGWILTINLLGIGIWIYHLKQEASQSEAYNAVLFKTTEALKQQITANQNDLTSIQQEYIQVERQRISRDLHDSVGHSLSTIIVQLGAIAKISEKGSPVASQMALKLKDFASQGLQEVRQVIHDLKPNHLLEASIIKGLEALFVNVQTNSSIKIDFRYNDVIWEPNPIQYQTIYRTCQESISNAQKHGQASQVKVTMIFSNYEVILTIQDNGIGCTLVNPHMGLTSIEQRVQSLGGHVIYQSASSAGFMTRIDLPRVKGVIE